MSRFEWDDYEQPEYRNGAELFEHNARLALAGRKGRAFLGELREALLNLPERRLIEGAFCKPKFDPDDRDEDAPPMAPTDFGVCSMGAYAWWQKVKAGMDPVKAFESLPTIDSEDGYGDEAFQTAYAGKEAGAPIILAWEMASANDETFEGLEPEVRFEKLLAWIDERLAEPEWHRGDPLPKRLGRSWATSL